MQAADFSAIIQTFSISTLAASMTTTRARLASSVILALALAACGQKEATAPSPGQGKPASSAAQDKTSPAGNTLAEAAPDQTDGATEGAGAAGVITPEEMARRTSEVYERFRTNFPQTADFRTTPVVVRIEPTEGKEIFEITTPYGIFYTDRQATWMIEGVLMMPSPDQDPAAQAKARAAGMPTPMMNVTMRPAAKGLYALVRDKEAAARSAGSESMSISEIYTSMPRDKAIILDYGRPDTDIVLLADILDPAAHTFFNELSKLDPNQVNMRLSVFPIAVEEIRPQALGYAASVLCAGFNHDQPTAPQSARPAELWKSFMSDGVALADPSAAWATWAKANGLSDQAPPKCPRNIEPGMFTRLANTLGLFGSPIALLPNGHVLSNSLTVAKIKETLASPAPEQKRPANPDPSPATKY